MEEFKKIEDVFEPDPRWGHYVKGNRKFTFEDLYALASPINLDLSVPEDILSKFNNTKNLFLFTWLDYTLTMNVRLQCFSLIEWSLREKVKLETGQYPNKQNFKQMMDKAISENWIDDSAFSHLSADVLDPFDPQKYCKTVFDIVRGFRNDMAHGSSKLYCANNRLRCQ